MSRIPGGCSGRWWWIWGAACYSSAGWWVDGWHGIVLVIVIVHFFNVCVCEVGCPLSESCGQGHVVDEDEWMPQKNQSSP